MTGLVHMGWRIGAAGAGAAFLVVATLALTGAPAQAKKCIAEATGFPCKKCHVSPSGGGAFSAYGQKYKAKGNLPC